MIKLYEEFINERKYDFKSPNAKTLTQIDAYMQNHKGISWEDTIISDLYGKSGETDGWADVEHNRESDFKKAWDLAMKFIKKHDIDIKDIEKF
jgi:hypothetical protein